MFQHGGANGEILAAQPDAILDRAGRMANLQPQIPQHIQHGFDHVLGPGSDLVGRQKQQVDIGKRRHLAPAIAADGNQRQSLAGGGRHIGMDDFGGQRHDRLDQLVGQISISRSCGPRGKGAFGKGFGNSGAALLLGLLQPCDDGIAHVHRRGVVLLRLDQRLRKGGRIKNLLWRTDQVDRQRCKLVCVLHVLSESGAAKGLRSRVDHDDLIVADGGNGQPAVVGAVAAQAENARSALKSGALRQGGAGQCV